MSLEERPYSLLVVSAGERFNASLTEVLPKSVLSTVQFAATASEGKRFLAERAFDFVLINSPLPDSSGISLAVDVCESRESVALLFVRAEHHEEVYSKVSGYGVFTLPRPVSRQAVAQAMGWLVSARERLRRLEQKNLSIEEKMAEIRLVNRAKWLLIQHKQMDEPTAHHWIERRAMDACVSKRQVAENILREFEEKI